MTEPFSAESRLIHAGTERVPGQPATPPLVPASIYVSQGTPRPGRGYGRDGNPGWERRARWPAETAPASLIRLSVGLEPAADLITDVGQALEVL